MLDWVWLSDIKIQDGLDIPWAPTPRAYVADKLLVAIDSQRYLQLDARVDSGESNLLITPNLKRSI